MPGRNVHFFPFPSFIIIIECPFFCASARGGSNPLFLYIHGWWPCLALSPRAVVGELLDLVVEPLSRLWRGRLAAPGADRVRRAAHAVVPEEDNGDVNFYV